MKWAWSRCSTCLSGAASRHGRGVSDLLQGLMQIGLSPREMECVRLRAEDLRYEEIAVVLGLQAGTVGALLARAHGKIRKAVSGGVRKAGDLAPGSPGGKTLCILGAPR